MLALVYLINIFIIGNYLLRQIYTVNNERWLIAPVASWVLGAISVTWLNFFICNAGESIKGSITTLAITTLASVFIVIKGRNKKVKKDYSGFFLDVAYLIGISILSTYIFWHSFSVNDGALHIGRTVWGDFGPHIATIQSFVEGNNFPPIYPHYANNNIPYHFLFHFFVSSLNSLGMRLDWAFNLPSLISLICVFVLIYEIAFKITRNKWVGFLAGIFFIFRSSFAFYEFSSNYALKDLFDGIDKVIIFIGKTPNENWGLWTQNVYANQRHFAIAIAAILLAVYLFLPLLNKESSHKKHWGLEQPHRAIGLGILLGALAFWNGAALISGLLVLAGLALFSKARLEYVIVAVIAVFLAKLQSAYFIGLENNPVNIKYFFGFLAQEKTIAGVAEYIFQAFGLLLPLFILSVIFLKDIRKYALGFIAPFAFGFLFAPTVDVAVNHKFIMIGNMLLGIPVAWLLIRIFKWNRLLMAIPVLAVITLMTITGVIDLKTYHNLNAETGPTRINNPVTNWIKDNTKPKSVFLGDRSVLDNVLMAGRPLYIGWSYYGWSAGYDTLKREQEASRIFGAGRKEDLVSELETTNIDYLLVDDAVRSSKFFVLNENLIKSTFPVAFKTDYLNTVIYKVDHSGQEK